MTDLRASQALVEVWTTTTSDRLVASQVAAEVWFRNDPTTSLIVSQALVEVWMPSPTGTVRRYRLMSEVV